MIVNDGVRYGSLRIRSMGSLYWFYYVCQFLFLIHSVVASTSKSILVVGSMNADTFLPISRLPSEGENLTLLPGKHPHVDLPGGKGCTQAVAASKLLQSSSSSSSSSSMASSSSLCKGVKFMGQFGNDAAADILKEALKSNGVDVSLCRRLEDTPSGRGYVFLTQSGSVSAVISGGSNIEGWDQFRSSLVNENRKKNNDQDNENEINMDTLFQNIHCVMLQREIPEFVNLRIAQEAKKRGILIFQDVGGEDRTISREMLQLCDYIVPNESELNRLLVSLGRKEKEKKDILLGNDDNDDDDDDNTIVQKAKMLQDIGANNVLVTRGSRGSTLLTESGDILHQPAYPLPPDSVMDETGAGDCFRAAFCVSFMEEQEQEQCGEQSDNKRPTMTMTMTMTTTTEPSNSSLQKCLAFASAAGACAVTKNGAVPSTPTREQVETMHQEYFCLENAATVQSVSRGGSSIGSSSNDGDDFPFLIGSRLNSMKDRPELWAGSLENAKDYVKRQATIDGLTCVDFNYPQHFRDCDWDAVEAKAALDEAGLKAGAVCLRYPSQFARGAMNHPDPKLRGEAIALTKEAAKVAELLGCDEVVVWSAYDGYDYPFQVDYDEKWAQVVEAFRECCDEFPDIKFSIEYKPTDENTRFFTVPSTGAALLLVHEIDRRNMGLTLDVGHMLMSGENPGQSIAMAGKKLFGIQLNDGYTRLAAEDGMMFGSVHPCMALEVMYQLKRIGFAGHFYFDTFPQRTDPVKEAEYNIERVKKFWMAVHCMDEKQLRQITDEHDALGAIKLVDEALRIL